MKNRNYKVLIEELKFAEELFDEGVLTPQELRIILKSLDKENQAMQKKRFLRD